MERATLDRDVVFAASNLSTARATSTRAGVLQFGNRALAAVGLRERTTGEDARQCGVDGQTNL
jgi:hypothetical protein